MGAVSKIAILASAALFAASCAVGPTRTSSGGGPRPHYKVGKPYKVNGRTYRPAVDPGYNRVGLASWYGPKFHGKPTANGEIFDKRRISAAHKTLPLPSIVEVRNLENGRRLFVRVNDRGPFVDNRIIDLSEAGARALGFKQKGLAKVRVRYVREAALYERAPSARGRRAYSEEAETEAPTVAAVEAEAADSLTMEPVDSARADLGLENIAPVEDETIIAEPAAEPSDALERENIDVIAALIPDTPSLATARRTPAPEVTADAAAEQSANEEAPQADGEPTPLLGAAIAPINPQTGLGAPIGAGIWVEIGTFETFDGLETAQEALGEAVDYAVFGAPDADNRFRLEAGPFESMADADAFTAKAVEAGYGDARVADKP